MSKENSTPPEDFPVAELWEGEEARDRATCGACGRSWDDGAVTSMTPTPSGRCPWEAYHPDEDEQRQTLSPGARLMQAKQAGLDAFWAAVAAQYPEVRTGDFPPWADMRLEAAVDEAIKVWIQYNAEDEDAAGGGDGQDAAARELYERTIGERAAKYGVSREVAARATRAFYAETFAETGTQAALLAGARTLEEFVLYFKEHPESGVDEAGG
jgi:hypothetical protein